MTALHTIGMSCVYLGHHVLEGLHDFGALGLLEVGETTGDHDDYREHDTEVQLRRERERQEIPLLHCVHCRSMHSRSI